MSRRVGDQQTQVGLVAVPATEQTGRCDWPDRRLVTQGPSTKDPARIGGLVPGELSHPTATLPA